MTPILVVAALIEKDGRILLSQRHPDDPLANLWEFPGGKVEADETPPQALARELREELGVDAEVGEPWSFVHHRYPGKDVLILVYRATITGGTPRPLAVAAVAWFTLAEAAKLAMPAADQPLLARLLAL